MNVLHIKNMINHWFTIIKNIIYKPVFVRLSTIGFLLLLSFNVSYLARHTPTNWDMLAYSWLALPDSEFSAEEKFTETYRLARSKLADKDYNQLLGRLPLVDETYREKVSQDPKLFEQQLGFYRVKPAMPLAMRGLGAFGLDPLDAGKYIVLFSYFCFGLLFFMALRSLVPTPIAATAAAAYGAIILFTTSVGWQITPDALSCLVLCGAFYVYQIKGNSAAAMGLLILSVLVRPDNAILCGVILISSTLLRIGSRKWLLIAAILLSLEYWALISSVNYYGWSAHFYVTFVERIADIKDFQSSLSFSDYVARYPTIMVDGVLHSFFLAFILLAQFLITSEIKGGRLGAFLKTFSRSMLFASGSVWLCFLVADFFGISLTAPAKYTVWFILIAVTFVYGGVLMFGIYFLPKLVQLDTESSVIRVLLPVTVYMMVHFSLFPIDKDRMLLASYLFTLYFFTDWLSRQFNIRRLQGKTI